MIPILGLPVLNRGDLAARMIRSIDHPVEELLVIVNGSPTDIRPPILDAVKANPRVGKIRWSTPGFNLGCGASWNFIIKSRPAGPWWTIVNADIVFGSGDLARLDDHMASAGGFAMLFEYGAFALDANVIDQVGWFDENYHPIYYEDRDYEHRLQVAGIEAVALEANCKHDTSSTIHSNQEYALRNNITFHDNANYFQAKWGGHPRSGSLWSIPFNGTRQPELSRRRLADQAW